MVAHADQERVGLAHIPSSSRLPRPSRKPSSMSRTGSTMPADIESRHDMAHDRAARQGASFSWSFVFGALAPSWDLPSPPPFQPILSSCTRLKWKETMLSVVSKRTEQSRKAIFSPSGIPCSSLGERHPGRLLRFWKNQATAPLYGRLEASIRGRGRQVASLRTPSPGRAVIVQLRTGIISMQKRESKNSGMETQEVGETT